MKTYKQIITIFVVFLMYLITNTSNAQSTIIKLPTDTDASNFSIQNNSGSTLFKAKGDALFEFNGLPFLTRDDDSNGQLVLRRNSNANEQIIIGFHSGDYGFIQTLEQSVAYRNLYLNPQGANVGIGGTSAGQKLEIHGNTLIKGTDGYDAAGERAYSYLGDTGAYISAKNGTGVLIGAYSAADALCVEQTTGNVGIGNTDPGQKLSVAGTIESTIGGFKFPDGSTQDKAASTSTTYWTASSTDIYNSNSGKVGIGTTTPESVFDVNGLTLLRSEAAMWQSEQRALVFGQYDHANPMTDRRHEILARVDNSYTGNTLRFRIHDGQSADGSTFADALLLRGDGRVGVATTSPSAQLHVAGTEGVLATGTIGSGTSLDLNAGTRMHWYPKKSAFRAGTAIGTEWNDGSIGNYSIALGSGNTASGMGSVSLGSSTNASGNYSVAIGSASIASGEAACAIGSVNYAQGDYSVALGKGAQVGVDGDGSFVFNCDNATTLESHNADEILMCFTGGYKFYSNVAHNLGAYMPENQNGWGSISDSTKKENIRLADGEYFLNSISKLKLGSWNYIGQDAQEFRHYGPMAQEIFHYFGNDGVGTIGCDTLLVSTDMDGIMMIALQALENRTDELQSENEMLKSKIEKLEIANTRMKELEKKYAKMEHLLIDFGKFNKDETASIIHN